VPSYLVAWAIIHGRTRRRDALDKFTFIAEMTKALAWPLVVFLVALLARKPVSVLLEGLRLQKFKGAGWEFEFSKLEAEVQEHVAELPAPPSKILSSPPHSVIVDADSLVTIVTEWVELERRVLEAAQERFAEKGKTSFSAALNALLQTGAIKPGTAEALRGLQALRNLAVHAPDDKTLASRVPHFRSMSQAMRWSLDHELGSSKK
jgi:hypothetical protein